MNLFKRQDAAAMSEPAITGVDVLRKTVHARNRSPHALSLIAREVDGIGAATLEDFAAGKADLGVETLKALTKVLYPHSEYDEAANLLRSANKQQATSYVPPDKFDPASAPYCFRVTSGPQLGPQPVVPPAREKPKATTRPGWAPRSQ
jgi:hypothetical protein